ncbi:MAG: hypothetical protein LC117_10435 [Bacteroidia bacterium]|nr:hypothetical protein [Bacteroidia bacterium]
MFWIILIIALILFVILGITGSKKQKANNAKLVEQGYTPENKIETGKYIAGHPDIDNPIQISTIYPKENKLVIMLEPPMAMPIKKGEIENSFIKNILAEDQSTIEKKVTVGRLLVTGVFAFALKKKKKNELAYLTIEWNDGKFDHETIFEFEGIGAMQKANTARNKLIKIVR